MKLEEVGMGSRKNLLFTSSTNTVVRSTMESIPQPGDSPYSVGTTAEIYIDPRDPDSQYHGMTVEVTDVHTDDLSEETGRGLDAYSYSVKDTVTGKSIPIQFRHSDLVPVE